MLHRQRFRLLPDLLQIAAEQGVILKWHHEEEILGNERVPALALWRGVQQAEHPVIGEVHPGAILQRAVDASIGHIPHPFTLNTLSLSHRHTSFSYPKF